MQRIASFALSGVLFFAFATEASADRAYTVRGVVASYQNYLKSIRNVSFQAHQNDRLAEEREFSNPRDEECKIDLAGHRSWRGTLIEDSMTNAEGESEDRYWEQLVTPDRDISLSTDPKTMQPDGVCAYLKVSPESWKVPGDVTLPLGFIFSGRAMIDPLREPLGVVAVKWRSGAPVVLTSKTAQRQLTLWLAPSKGWMPERIEYRRTTPVAEGGELTHLIYTVKQARQIAGIWFPEKFTVEDSTAAGKHQMPPGIVERQEVVSENGVESTITVCEIVEGAEGSLVDVPGVIRVAEVALADIKLNSLTDADFHLKATIPDGTKVSMQDNHRDDYVWQDGKAVLVPETPPLFERFYGQAPPELEITDARGVPKTVKLADLRGKWVVLDFWALSCGPCIARSLPELAEFYREHANDHDRFEILAVFLANWADEVRTMDEFDRLVAPIMEEHWDGKPLPYPVLLDGDQKTLNAYGVEGVPETLLIDPEGSLVKGGSLEMLAEKLRQAKR